MIAYVEVSRLQNNADRLENQLNVALKLKTKMRKHTREQYSHLAVSLLDCVTKITELLEMDSLASVDELSEEFDSIDDAHLSQIKDAIQSTQAEFDEYESFTHSSDSCDNVNKNTLKMYGQVIDSAVKTDYEYREELECAQMIKMWFSTRFSSSAATSFKYNIEYLPKWISGIIIAYGKHLARGDTYQFKETLFEWCNKVKSDPEHSKWALPYEIQQICSGKAISSDYTMEAVLLGDLLMDDVFYKLTTSPPTGKIIVMDCAPVASAVKKHNPELSNEIQRRIANKQRLLDTYQFTNKMKGEE